MPIDVKRTDIVKRRYNRFAPLYDLMEGIMEGKRADKWRKTLWSKIEGSRILEVGVGTGRNLPFYPKDKEIVAIDLAERMLNKAMHKAQKLDLNVKFELMDAQDLRFPDNSFDSVVASFVFCSVPDPVLGLTEIKRVVKPGGKVILLEHMLSSNRIVGFFMNLLNPVAVLTGGENINRRTVENVVKSGLILEKVTELALGIVKLVEASKPNKVK